MSVKCGFIRAFPLKAIALQLRKNLFETPYAQTLLAFTGSPDAPGEAIGMALYFFNYSTWTGKPGIYVCGQLGSHD